jgi:undecaprenyl-diphosphatase
VSTINLKDYENISAEFDENKIPKYSETLTGRAQQPMNFMIISRNDDELKSFFEKAGWYLARKPNIKSMYLVAKSAFLNKEDKTGPITPSFWNEQVHSFGFQKSTPAKTARQRHHSRFWKTNIVKDGKSVYVGTASFDKGIKWFITHQIDPDIDTEVEYLFNDLKSTGLIKNYKKENFVKPVLGKNLAGDQFFTRGEIYIIEL